MPLDRVFMVSRLMTQARRFSEHAPPGESKRYRLGHFGFGRMSEGGEYLFADQPGVEQFANREHLET